MTNASCLTSTMLTRSPLAANETCSKPQAGTPQAPASKSAWSRSLPHIAHLDAHMLQDIGAPGWVINEIGHRQAQPGKTLRFLLGR